MAEGKKSFVAYSDWYGMFKALPDEVAGKLIKHIFSYVNDENPTTEDFIINALFEQVKSTLKRDLKKWQEQQEQRKKAGIRSAEVRKQNATLVNASSISSTDSVNVNVNDNVIVNDIVKENNNTASPFSFFNSLINYGFDKNLVSDWLKVRKTKKATNTETSFNSFIKEIEKRNCNLNEILEYIIVKNWSGFKWSWYDTEKEKEKSFAKKEKETEPIVIGRQTMSTVQQNMDMSGVVNPWLKKE